MKGGLIVDTGIDAIIKVYTQEALEETAKDASLKLEENIKNELQEGKHSPYDGYETGELMGSIRAPIQEITDTYAIITGIYTAPHGDFVLAGVRGKKKVNPIDFLGDGLEKTIQLYGG